jgi:ABC-type uncharacterized transport system permease subunit
MTRFIFLTLLNLSLPFLIHYLRKKLIKMWQRRNEPHVIDVTPEEHTTPMFKLLLIGLVLLTISLITIRFTSSDVPSSSYKRSTTLSIDY